MDRILIQMPGDYEAFLAALAALQDYLFRQIPRICQVYGGDGLYELTVHIPNSKLDWLKPCFGPATFIDEFRPVRGEWDSIHVFDIDRAYEIAKFEEKNLAQAFGLFFGSDPPSLPNLIALGSTPVVYEILLLEFPGWMELRDLIQKNRPEYQVESCDYLFPGNEEEYINVCSTQLLVGPRCGATYLASCHGRAVVELYSKDKHKRWLSKWSNRNYSMVYGHTFPPDVIWKAVESALDRGLVRHFLNVPQKETAESLTADVVWR